MIHHVWRLSEGGDDNLGVAVTGDGLVLGRTPLVERRDGRFVARDRSEVGRLLGRAYGIEPVADRVMPGLSTVAAALNANDPCLARIAAVHLRLPDVPNQPARDQIEAEDLLIKSADWNPALHPRAETPPNPGWFAPTVGAGDDSSAIRTAQNNDATHSSDASSKPDDGWVRLSPGHQRIDELADFVEWMANAQPGDEQAISAEIKRYFYDVGDQGSAHALNSALTVLLRPGLTKEDRQKLLNSLDVYTRADPAEWVHIRDWTTGAALVAGSLPPAAAGRTAASEEATEGATGETAGASEATATEAATANAPSEVWKYGWARRGREIHDQLGDSSLHPNFPTIDMFSPSGVATSIKSVDLNAGVYQNDNSLTYRLNNYFDKVSEFNGARFADDIVSSDKITSRALQLVIPKGSMTDAQQIVIEVARARAKNLKPSVDLIITPF
jgi:hypothetical protein